MACLVGFGNRECQESDGHSRLMACLSIDAVGHSQTGVLSGLGEDGTFLLLYRFLHQPHSSGFTLQNLARACFRPSEEMPSSCSVNTWSRHPSYMDNDVQAWICKSNSETGDRNTATGPVPKAHPVKLS